MGKIREFFNMAENRRGGWAQPEKHIAGTLWSSWQLSELPAAWTGGATK